MSRVHATRSPAGCERSRVSRSGYYRWKRSPISDRDLADAVLLAVIDQIHTDSKQTYGSPRVHAELRLGRDIRVGRKRVERLMRRGGLVAVSTRRPKGATRRDPKAQPAPDLVERDFSASEPDQLWIADFCQVATWQGTAYIAVVADAHSRLCLGWSVRPDKTADLVLEALEMAIWRRARCAPPVPSTTPITGRNTPVSRSHAGSKTPASRPAGARSATPWTTPPPAMAQHR